MVVGEREWWEWGQGPEMGELVLVPCHLGGWRKYDH